jgi:dipeptidyl aminopeptidase/acylaminoacyl peptidase
MARWRRSITFGIGGLGLLAACHTREAPLIPRAQLFAAPAQLGPTLSPDGQRVAYLAPARGELDIRVRTLDASGERGPGADRIVAAVREPAVHGLTWQRDGRHLLYLAGRQGDENHHVYQIDIETHTTRDLTPYPGVSAELLPPDPHALDHILVALDERDPSMRDLYRIDLATGAVTLEERNPGDIVSWAASGEMLVAAAYTARGHAEVRLRPRRGAPWRVLWRGGMDESKFEVVGITTDNRSVFLISSDSANTARLLSVSIATGASEVLSQNVKYDVDRAVRRRASGMVDLVHYAMTRGEWFPVDTTLWPDLEVLRNAQERSDFDIVSRDDADRRWIVSYTADNAPFSYWLYDRRTRELRPLFDPFPALRKFVFARTIPIAFQARDGLRLQGYLTIPPYRQRRKLPLVIDVHGGPWERDVWGFDPRVQWLANRGYAVLQVNFRGSSGYGSAFARAGNGQWGGAMEDDLLDGKEWAVRRGFADSKRVCIIGEHYGGYAALAGLTFAPEELRCGIAVDGPSNLITLVQSYPAYPAPYRAMLLRRIGDAEAGRALLEARSPVFHTDRITAPLLIARGASDPPGLREDTDRLVAALRSRGRKVEYVVFANGTGLEDPTTRLRFYARMESFLARYLRGRVERSDR